MSVKNIYTVDDYPLAAYTVKKTIEAFSSNECIVSDFEDPLTLLEKFKEEFENIDLIITDYEMPDLHGSKLIKELRAIKPTIKIIVISAWLDSVNSKETALIGKEVKALKPNLILPKPFPDGWIEKLDEILESKETVLVDA